MEAKSAAGKKRNLIVQTWARCKSLGKAAGGSAETEAKRQRRRKKGQVAPEGCFTVYVGEEKQRFVVKTEYANHPMFRVLLEEAESEFGYNPEGPLLLPCDVACFWKVLVAMDSADDEEAAADEGELFRQVSCGKFAAAKRHGSYRQFCPSPMLALNRHVKSY
ncbi:unnamed protein product [Linum trigynum]|uniref:Uncharacterized protein n=1 Tax=Linum trigynum TaxID=586398 RepID=A0AAV2CGZ1_9ROSI